MILQEHNTLANGMTIPKLGLGTWFIEDEKAAEAVRFAVAMGYQVLFGFYRVSLLTFSNTLWFCRHL